MGRTALLLLAFLLLTTVASAAQQEDLSPDLELIDTTLFSPDSTITLHGSVSDSINYEEKLYQKPMTALFKSALIPGWGQWGNRRKFRALALLGFQVWLISTAVDHGMTARDFRNQWEDAETAIDRNHFYDLYESSRDSRNKYTWFAVITSFLSMFDAYIDAHMSGSPKHQDEHKLSIDFSPGSNETAQVSLSYSF
ncbi:MAG: DUF5683 domain-containing protein [candidate division Zixibacteria bacterium]